MGVGTAWLAMCRRKRHHATEAEAAAAAARMHEQGERGLGWYRCPYCGDGWLLGRRGPRVGGRGLGASRRPKAAARETWESLKRKGA